MAKYPASVPVVIVGAGPTGLTAANLLATYGVDAIVLDREPAPMNLPRAIVLDDVREHRGQVEAVVAQERLGLRWRGRTLQHARVEA